MTLDELARRTGEPVERLQKWRSLGLIGAEGREQFGPEDVERVRLIQLFLRRGISLEAIVQAAKEGGRFERYLSYVERLSPGTVATAYSLAEAAEVVGLDLDVVRRFWDASGGTEQGEILHEDDLAMIRRLKQAIEAGFPQEALLQLVRVYTDALGRVAEAEQRLFHFYVIERLKTAELSGLRLVEETQSIGGQMNPMTDPSVVYFHHRGLARAARDDLIMHLAEEAGLLEKAHIPGQLQAAIAFVDLSSFTPLAEAMGDLKAADVLARFSALVREATSRCDGRVVKQIGDAFMLVFPDPPSAVACALEIEEQAAREPQFPAVRSGVHWGPVLYREGDYLGSNVNIASRLAAEAQRHQVLVTAAVRKEARGLPQVEFVRLGRRRLKGLAEELEVFEARPGVLAGRVKAIDPVCGMELGPAEVAASLSLEGKERAFCSEECLRRFVAAPERYSS